VDFFEQQQSARRNTAWMLLLFIVAVIAIVAAFNLVSASAYNVWIFVFRPRVFSHSVGWFQQVPRDIYVWTTVVVVFAIAWGTVSRLYILLGGGAAVAELVGARRLKWNTGDPRERRLLNSVEEMALASGISVPQVFVMDDEWSINAFAAGYSPGKAAVIVTLGALENLDRDELQGVMAHEFSHILNGDMRLNTELLGVIAGIVLIGSLGASLMGDFRRGNLMRSEANPNSAFFLAGWALWLIGSIGVLAGRLIRATISREREFLADASAVQFTRNPEGIGGALFKIGKSGGFIAPRYAEELSHMCISTPLNDYFQFPWFHTHPPLDERINHLLGPNAQELLSERMARAEAAALTTKESPLVNELVSPLFARVVGGGSDAAGTARAIPAELRAAAATVEGAQAVLFSLLLGEGSVRERRLSLIGKRSTAEVTTQSASFADALELNGARNRLPLFELAASTLKMLSRSERGKLLGTIQGLIEADHKVTPDEFVLLTLCRRRFHAEDGKPPTTHKGIASVANETEVVLSLLAHWGGGGVAAFDKGMAVLGIAGGALRSPTELTNQGLEAALHELELLAPSRKPLIIKACLAVVMVDEKLTFAESELLRAICAALDTPLPPILKATEAAA